MNGKDEAKQSADLRRRAEEKAQENTGQMPENLEQLSPDEVKRLMHELRVHQIELEMQNEELRRAQTELGASRELYFDLYDMAPVGYVSINVKGIILQANLTIANLLGVTRSALVKQPLTRFIFPEDQDIYYRHRKELFDTGVRQECELRMIGKEDSIFWARIDAVIDERDGNELLNRCTMYDISERKQAENRELLAREVLELLNRSHSASDMIRDILLTIKKRSHIEAVGIRLREGDDFPYYATNGFAENFVEAERYLCTYGEDGKAIRDENGNPVLDCMCGNVLCGRTDPSKPFFTEGGSFWSNETTELLSSTTEADRQLCTRNRCNSEGFESVALIPLRHGAEVIGLLQLNDRRANRFTLEMIHFFEGLGASLGVALSHKRAGEKIALAASEWQTTFDAMDDIVWVLDRDQRILRSNKSVEQAFNIKREELIGKHCWEIVHGTQEPIAECPIHRAKESLQRETMALRIGERWYEVKADPIINAAGQYAGAVHIVSDITERKRTESMLRHSEDQLRQSQKMEAVGRLAGGVAHDFNNMLVVINGYSEMAIESLKPSDPLKKDIEEIYKTGQRSAELTRQLLAFSRKQLLVPEIIDMNKIVTGVEPMLRRLIGEDINIAIYPAGDLGKVTADPGQIEQMIMNLAVNSRDAMPKGGKLTIETQNVELDDSYVGKHIGTTPGQYVMLSMADTGCGMDAKTLEQIFEPFYTTKEQGKGTGLGLSTVYGIIKQSGGNIYVYSEPGKGTTFKIYLPRELSVTEVTADKKKEDLLITGTETILVVEDEQGVRNLTKRILEASGYTVHTAASGGEAFLMCERIGDSIHLMLTDIVMPEMSGRELAERLVKIYPNMKVLFMSGYTEDTIVHHGVLDHNMNFISKPFSLPALTAKVREVLDG